MRGAGREAGRGRSRKNRQSESEGGVSGWREGEGAWIDMTFEDYRCLPDAESLLAAI